MVADESNVSVNQSGLEHFIKDKILKFDMLDSYEQYAPKFYRQLNTLKLKADTKYGEVPGYDFFTTVVRVVILLSNAPRKTKFTLHSMLLKELKYFFGEQNALVEAALGNNKENYKQFLLALQHELVSSNNTTSPTEMTREDGSNAFESSNIEQHNKGWDLAAADLSLALDQSLRICYVEHSVNDGNFLSAFVSFGEIEIENYCPEHVNQSVKFLDLSSNAKLNRNRCCCCGRDVYAYGCSSRSQSGNDCSFKICSSCKLHLERRKTVCEPAFVAQSKCTSCQSAELIYVKLTSCVTHECSKCSSSSSSDCYIPTCTSCRVIGSNSVVCSTCLNDPDKNLKSGDSQFAPEFIESTSSSSSSSNLTCCAVDGTSARNYTRCTNSVSWKSDVSASSSNFALCNEHKMSIHTLPCPSSKSCKNSERAFVLIPDDAKKNNGVKCFDCQRSSGTHNKNLKFYYCHRCKESGKILCEDHLRQHYWNYRLARIQFVSAANSASNKTTDSLHSFLNRTETENALAALKTFYPTKSELSHSVEVKDADKDCNFLRTYSEICKSRNINNSPPTGDQTFLDSCSSFYTKGMQKKRTSFTSSGESSNEGNNNSSSAASSSNSETEYQLNPQYMDVNTYYQTGGTGGCAWFKLDAFYSIENVSFTNYDIIKLKFSPDNISNKNFKTPSDALPKLLQFLQQQRTVSSQISPELETFVRCFRGHSLHEAIYFANSTKKGDTTQLTFALLHVPSDVRISSPLPQQLKKLSAEDWIHLTFECFVLRRASCDSSTKALDDLEEDWKLEFKNNFSFPKPTCRDNCSHSTASNLGCDRCINNNNCLRFDCDASGSDAIYDFFYSRCAFPSEYQEPRFQLNFVQRRRLVIDEWYRRLSILKHESISSVSNEEEEEEEEEGNPSTASAAATSNNNNTSNNSNNTSNNKPKNDDGEYGFFKLVAEAARRTRTRFIRVFGLDENINSLRGLKKVQRPDLTIFRRLTDSEYQLNYEKLEIFASVLKENTGKEYFLPFKIHSGIFQFKEEWKIIDLCYFASKIYSFGSDRIWNAITTPSKVVNDKQNDDNKNDSGSQKEVTVTNEILVRNRKVALYFYASIFDHVALICIINALFSTSPSTSTNNSTIFSLSTSLTLSRFKKEMEKSAKQITNEEDCVEDQKENKEEKEKEVIQVLKKLHGNEKLFKEKFDDAAKALEHAGLLEQKTTNNSGSEPTSGDNNNISNAAAAQATPDS